MPDIFSIKKAYLVGIKGAGMTALAEILQSLKIEVVGSDTTEKFFTDKVLKRKRIKFYEGFKKENLKKELPVDLVISSVAYLPISSQDFAVDKKVCISSREGSQKFATKNNVRISSHLINPEISLAQKLNIPILTYPQALAQIFNQSFGIAICGSHGKSSTTAILGKVFQEANLDPTVLVGSEVIEWKSNALISKNFLERINFFKKNEEKLKNLNWLRKNLKKLPIFIIEADEYREAFLNYFPRIIIITNIDYDHPDYFKNEKEYKDAFKKFIKNLQEPKILIDSSKPNQKVNPFTFPLPGSHWQKNLNLIYKLIKILKIPEEKFFKAIQAYQGLRRRLEIVFHKDDIYFIDDYAHHPREVLSFYQSLKEKFPDYFKFFIFQPHTFTRTHYLFKEFEKVFRIIKKDKNTKIIIFKTFPSAREKDIILKIKNLKKEIDLVERLKLLYFEKEKNLIEFLKRFLISKTVISTVGAGDIYKILEKLKDKL